jgi:hypothetical protein
MQPLEDFRQPRIVSTAPRHNDAVS